MTVYVSLPLTGPRAAKGTDAADGARLALEQAGGAAGDLEIRAEFLDDANGAVWDPVAVGRNARRAVQDSSTAAYLGELDSQPTRASVPITNDAGLAQISPGAGAVDLTRPAQGYPDSPERYQPSGSESFARVIPADSEQSAAAAALAAEIGAARIAIDADKTAAGELLRSELTADAAGVGIEVVGPNEDPDVTISPSAGGSLRLSGEGDFEISSALDPSELPGGEFAAEFAARFGRDPGPYAAYGYEAMDLALQAIADGERNEGFRRSVLNNVLDAERPDSILGSYSITEDGDTTLCAVQPYEGGRPRKPICPTG